MALPKPPGERARRNVGQRDWRTLQRGAVEVPLMPGATSLTQRQRQEAQAYWDALWTEYGELYTRADRFPLGRLCKLHARAMVARRGLSAQAEGELRQLEAAYAGSPLGRLKLMVQVGERADVEESAPNGVIVDMAAQRARRARIENGEEA